MPRRAAPRRAQTVLQMRAKALQTPRDDSDTHARARAHTHTHTHTHRLQTLRDAALDAARRARALSGGGWRRLLQFFCTK